ncbi:MAG: glutamate synthase-related protein [Candidatus Aureabacteria bacterium]|nr:glutamate synthase-related protein [Candidatus Auribacterota bacterium]
MRENARTTSGTSVRVSDPSPLSGMCPLCIRECKVLCEVGKSAFRGREVLYPEPEKFGESTAASNKDYGLNWTDFQIMVEVRGTKGIEEDSDKALFPNVDVFQTLGGIKVKIPVIIPGLGSTDVARRNWLGLSIGAAISGVIDVIGENVCGMDEDAKFDSNGKVIDSPQLKFRVDHYRKFWDGKFGDIGVQTNVEDQRCGVAAYAINTLGVNIIERKWGQGAKNIGGEVRIYSLEKAIMLKKRGYVVIPDPEDAAVQEAFRKHVFDTFERHSRVGMPEFGGFVEDIKRLRGEGAKKVFLKTGSPNPYAIAFILKCASAARVDLLTLDGGGGGTGMSPVPMMQECSTPTIYLESIVLEAARILKKKGKFIPDIVIAGGFVNETQIFKAIAMSNFGDGPIVKGVAMARAPITAAMKADYFTKLAEAEDLPHAFRDRYSDDPSKFFITMTDLKARYGAAVGKELPWTGVGVYTYFDRIKVGLQQLIAGCKKFRLDLIDREDLASLTPLARDVAAIPMIHEYQRKAFENILEY